MEFFRTEEDCIRYLASVRWSDGFICTKCGNDQYWIGNRNQFICTNCRNQVKVQAGTIMQDSKLPALVWLCAMWFFATFKNGVSAKSLQENLGINSYRSAWSLLHKLRIAMIRSDREPLSGIVEIDEVYIGGFGEGGKRGRGSENKQLVVIAVQLEKIETDKPHDPLRDYRLAKIRTKCIENASKEELHSFIKENIAPGSTLIRDSWTGYDGIDQFGYISEIYKTSKANSENEKLPHVHLAISLIKRWILGTYQGSIDEDHLQTYLEEYTFRFNRKSSHSRGWLFFRLSQGVMSTVPHPYENLIKQHDDAGQDG